MTRSTTLRLLAGIFCVAVVAIVATSGAAGAVQEAENITNGTEQETEYMASIGEDVRLVDARMVERGTVELRLEADERSDIAVTDASQELGGMSVTQIRRQQKTIPEGTSTVRFVVENPSQPAVTVATREGMIGIGDQEFDQPRPAVDWSTVQLLLAATAIAAVAGTYRLVKKKREDESPDYEQIL